VASNNLLGLASKNFSAALLELNLQIQNLVVVYQSYYLNWLFIYFDHLTVVPFNHTFASQTNHFWCKHQVRILLFCSRLCYYSRYL